jgi:predicted DNA-binding transcriptional regulator AlpA
MLDQLPLDFITIKESCALIGGDKNPVHPSTYYRGVAAGIYPAPVHVAPGLSRVVRAELIAALRKRVAERDDEAVAS